MTSTCPGHPVTVLTATTPSSTPTTCVHFSRLLILLASTQILFVLASSPLELSEFLWVDFLVENGTSGGVAVTRPVTWQLEYPGQAPEAEKDKMVWEILVSERDIRALVPLAKVRGPQLFLARLGA